MPLTGGISIKKKREMSFNGPVSILIRIPRNVGYLEM
jgi:hypothetical protein